ncbi:hypothetical protein [Bacillus sp. 2205SS5-2]|uniref:hypothetical protein n=1 Tax=Bacillus sp. 2205SS5-2 TaxID=3109031 RepID=UPI003005306B
MSISKFITSLILAFCLTIVFRFLAIPEPVSFFLIFCIVLLYLYLPFIYSIYYSKNINRIDRFLEKNDKQPMMKLYYALGNGKEEEIQQSLLLLKQKYRNSRHMSLFTVIASLHQNDLKNLKTDIDNIPQREYRLYYDTLFSIMIRESEKVINEKLTQIKKEWMKDALKAELAKRKGNRNEALRLSNSAAEKARGIQYYLLVKELDKMNNIA